MILRISIVDEYAYCPNADDDKGLTWSSLLNSDGYSFNLAPCPSHAQSGADGLPMDGAATSRLIPSGKETTVHMKKTQARTIRRSLRHCILIV